MKNLVRFAGVLTLFAGLCAVIYATSFSDTYDTATPLGTDAPSVIDDRIREVKAGVQERQNVDHYWPLTGTQVSDADAGEHRKILFHAPIAATPTVAADHGDLRIMDVAGKAELVWTDEDENELVLTSVGALNTVSADLLGTLANATYFTAVDQAGTGTVDLIQATAADVAQLPDGTVLATSGAPTADAQIANKKYVDDQANMSPVSYAGENSVTFQNGFILKFGTSARNGDPTTVNFSVAFPGGIVTAVACAGVSTSIASDTAVSSIGTTGINIKNADANATTYRWVAFGY